jgi:hypothetical protein
MPHFLNKRWNLPPTFLCNETGTAYLLHTFLFFLEEKIASTKSINIFLLDQIKCARGGFHTIKKKDFWLQAAIGRAYKNFET